MNDDLIARWKAVKLGPNGYCSSPLVELIADTIAALSPVLPEDVRRVLVGCRDASIDWDDVTDLIERLARENAMWEKAAHYWKDNYTELQARIEELTDEIDNEKARGVHSCGPNCERPLCVAHRKIAEYEKALESVRDYMPRGGKKHLLQKQAAIDLERIRGME